MVTQKGDSFKVDGNVDGIGIMQTLLDMELEKKKVFVGRKDFFFEKYDVDKYWYFCSAWELQKRL